MEGSLHEMPDSHGGMTCKGQALGGGGKALFC
jgi:hypothetical protein